MFQSPSVIGNEPKSETYLCENAGFMIDAVLVILQNVWITSGCKVSALLIITGAFTRCHFPVVW